MNLSEFKTNSKKFLNEADNVVKDDIKESNKYSLIKNQYDDICKTKNIQEFSDINCINKDSDFTNNNNNIYTDYKFTDNMFYFKETISSSNITNCLLNKNSSLHTDKYDYIRLSEFEEFDMLKIFDLNSEINNINFALDIQQYNNECGYFLSCMLILAKYPKLILNIFEDTNINEIGIFKLKIYLHGIPTFIVIDDYFPVVKKKSNILNEKYSINDLAFCKVNKETLNIWVILIEKMWAKLNLSYENILIGSFSSLIETITPTSITTYYNNIHYELLFNKIKHNIDKEYIVCCDISDDGSGTIKKLQDSGLISTHIYQIIEAVNLDINSSLINNKKSNLITNYNNENLIVKSNNVKEIKQKILKISNPWNCHEWIGEWSSNSRIWNNDLKSKLNYNENKDNNIFCISYENYLNFYTTTHICNISNNYYYNYKKFYYIIGNNTKNIVKINVKRNSFGSFLVNLKNKHIYKNLKGLENFENKFCIIYVFKKNEYIVDNKINYKLDIVGSTFGRKSKFEIDIDRIYIGDYYLYIHIPQNLDILTNNDNILQSQDFNHKSINNNIITNNNNYNETEFKNLSYNNTEIISYLNTNPIEKNISYSVGVYSSNNYNDIKKLDDIDDTIEISIKNIVNSSVSKLLEKNASNNNTSTNNNNLDIVKDQSVFYFKNNSISDCYRCINYEKDTNGLGYIYYKNNSDCQLTETLNISKIINISFIPIVNIDNKAVEKYIYNNSFYIQDECEYNIFKKLLNYNINNFKDKFFSINNKNLESYNFKYISNITNENNQLVVQLNIPSFSEVYLIIQKHDINNSLIFNSNVSIYYPVFSILYDYKIFRLLELSNKLDSELINIKINKLIYDNKEVDIYETIIEQPCGIIFKYKNKTNYINKRQDNLKPLIVNINMQLYSIDNLKFNEKINCIVNNEDINTTDIKLCKYYLKDLYPGDMKVLVFDIIDINKNYSYNIQAEYAISIDS